MDGRLHMQCLLKVDVVIGADGANSRVAKAIDAGEYNFAIAFQVCCILKKQPHVHLEVGRWHFVSQHRLRSTYFVGCFAFLNTNFLVSQLYPKRRNADESRIPHQQTASIEEQWRRDRTQTYQQGP